MRCHVVSFRSGATLWVSRGGRRRARIVPLSFFSPNQLNSFPSRTVPFLDGRLDAPSLGTAIRRRGPGVPIDVVGEESMSSIVEPLSQHKQASRHGVRHTSQEPVVPFHPPPPPQPIIQSLSSPSHATSCRVQSSKSSKSQTSLPPNPTSKQEQQTQQRMDAHSYIPVPHSSPQPTRRVITQYPPPPNTTTIG